MRPIIYPYKMGSKSARALSSELKHRRAKRVRSDGKYRPYKNHLIINWGNSSGPISWGLGYGGWLNSVISVAVASNKLSAFRRLAVNDVPIPDFTTEVEEANEWLKNGHAVVCRRLLRASGGKGIHIIGPDDAGLVQAPLYVKYIKKAEEYRVHVFNKKVIDVQQKKARKGVEEVNYKIRNHENGWVFCREEISPPDEALSIAVDAVNALGLDFGAVDIIYNKHYDKCYVLEVNTAPGLEGSTLGKYVQAIEEML